MNNKLKKLAATFILSVSSILVSQMGFAAINVEQTLDLINQPNIKLEVQRGHVEIIGWNNNSVSVKGQRDELSQGFIFEQQGNTLIIEDTLPKSYSSKNKSGSNLVIFIPNNTQLNATGISANYQVKQLNGNINIALVSGNIKAENLTGEIQLNSKSGSINAQHLNGTVNLESISGEITDTHTSGKATYRVVSGNILSKASQVTDLAINSVSGDITGTHLSVEKINIVSISGDIELALSDAISDAFFDTISADVTLTFHTMPNAAFNIDGAANVRLNNQLTQDQPIKQAYSPSAKLKFNTGNAKGNIKINTVSGKIALFKASK